MMYRKRYRKVRVSRDTTRQNSRLIMEAFLGRSLSRQEVVHHENEDCRDDRPENLSILSHPEHTRLHLCGRPLSEEHRQRIGIGVRRARMRKVLPSFDQALSALTYLVCVFAAYWMLSGCGQVQALEQILVGAM